MISLNRRHEIVRVVKFEEYDHMFDPPLSEEEQDYFDYMKMAFDAASENFPRKMLMIDCTVNNGWDDDDD